MSIVKSIIKSWQCTNGTINTMEELLSWVKEITETTYVNINECSINDSTFWFYDDYNGEILNRKRSFFSIKGMRLFVDGEFVKEQPMIIQPEIGYLGIICKEIDGTMYMLMQAKIEPGNVNCVQISPTIQATKSNFTRAHGGNLPAYFKYFEESWKHEVVYDQIQSEQATRFYKKRNRNMVIVVDDDIEVLPNFRWMTLGQIKKLMMIDNLVNMDTRTVLSGLPLITSNIGEEEKEELKKYFSEGAFFESMFNSRPQDSLPRIYQVLNNYKMFRDVKLATVPLFELADWKIDEYGITCKKTADFMVRYYEIEVAGREVRKWTQPLVKAIGSGTIGLLTTVIEGVRRYLVSIKPEIGCWVEIGPSVQWEPTHYLYNDDCVEQLFRKKMETRTGIVKDVILSEEGGRFYHEQNRNVIIDIAIDELEKCPNNYIWTDFSTLNYLIQVNNCLNIQLRNLISLLDI